MRRKFRQDRSGKFLVVAAIAVVIIIILAVVLLYYVGADRGWYGEQDPNKIIGRIDVGCRVKYSDQALGRVAVEIESVHQTYTAEKPQAMGFWEWLNGPQHIIGTENVRTKLVFTVTNPAAGYSAVGSCEWEKNVPAFSIQYEDKNADKPFAVSQTGLYNIQVQLYRLDGSAWNLMDSATSTVMVR